MKRLLSILLTLIMILSLSIPAFATEANTSGTQPTDSQVQEYALTFMTRSQENSNITISNFIHLYDGNGKVTGYYVTFDDIDVPAGYVLISLISGPSPIVEFSFEGYGPLDTATIPLDASSESSEKIIFAGPGAIYIPALGDKYYSVYDQELGNIYEDEIAPISNVDLYDGIIDWGEANIDSDSVYKILNFGAGTDYWLMEEFASGGVCYPTAATNILWYWGVKRNRSSVMDKVASKTTDFQKAKAIFDIMHDKMGTSETSTWDINILNGYNGFFGQNAGQRGIWSSTKIGNNSSFSTYKSALDDDCPIQLVLHTKNGILFDKGDGHGVMVLGYADSVAGTHYLFVMDGWNTYGRFVKLDYYPYMFGYKIWVK